jgi:S1-C subfamily serine protease
MLRRVLFGAAALAAAVSAAWLINGGTFTMHPEHRDATGYEPPPRVDMGTMPVWAALNEEMAQVTERVMPGVVSIQVQRRRMVEEHVNRGGSIHKEERPDTEPGVGSGCIVSTDGHILTNWHVVEGGEDSIYVTLSGEELSHPAELVDKDEQRDLAFLKIDPQHDGERFSALSLGDSGKLRRGHMVLAMGSPFGLRETVTPGIISHRARRVSDTYTSYLQTSCVINPGNSGGPLVNLHGEMVGIVTRKLLGPGDESAAEGYGLAIPSDDLKLALDSFMNKGRAQPYLGVTVEDWPEHYWLKQEEPDAAVVKGVTKDSPAQKAGLILNDVIESLDGERINGVYSFWRRVRLHKPGETLSLIIRRGKEAKPLQAVLADLPAASTTSGTVYGVRVRPLLEYEQMLLTLPDHTGLRVEEVDPGSPLATVLAPRTYILAVSKQKGDQSHPVGTPAEFKERLDELKDTGGYIVAQAPGKDTSPVHFPPLH